MSIWDAIYSGESLRPKWGEILPMPAQKRLYTIELAVQNVRNSASVQEANADRSQERAAEVVDHIMQPKTPTSRNVFSQAIDRSDSTAPSTPAQINVETSANPDQLTDAYQKLSKIYGEDNA